MKNHILILLANSLISVTVVKLISLIDGLPFFFFLVCKEARDILSCELTILKGKRNNPFIYCSVALAKFKIC